MRPLVKRIVVNGLFTAAILAGLGYVYAELASMWLAGQPVPRAEAVEAAAATNNTDALRDALRLRVPLTMALGGFAFIAVGELLLYWWRGNPPAVVKKTSAEPQADPAEKLLEELMQQADAAMAAAKEPAHSGSPRS